MKITDSNINLYIIILLTHDMTLCYTIWYNYFIYITCGYKAIILYLDNILFSYLDVSILEDNDEDLSIEVKYTCVQNILRWGRSFHSYRFLFLYISTVATIFIICNYKGFCIYFTRDLLWLVIYILLNISLDDIDPVILFICHRGKFFNYYISYIQTGGF